MYSAVVRALAERDRRRYTQKYGGNELSLGEDALLGSLGCAHRYTRFEFNRERKKGKKLNFRGWFRETVGRKIGEIRGSR